MFKALLRKQMLEIKRMYFRRRRRNDSPSAKPAGNGLMVLFIFLYLIIAGSFYALASLIGADLMTPDLSWIYFMIMNGMAFLAGILGSVFTTAYSLFQATDNEFLIALPIPFSRILIARMVSVYIMSLIYESMVFLPSILYYFFNGRPSVLSIILCILGFFILGFVVLVFSCFFGWLVALITSKLKRKAFLSVFISVIFIGLFMWFRFQAGGIFRNLAEHAQEIGDSVQGWGYPIYALGRGMSGDILSFLAFIGIAAVLFFLTCLILSKSFMRIVSAKDESVKADFSTRQIRTAKVSAALRRKEFKRFTASPNYMLNCGFGCLLLLGGAVLLLVKSADIRQLIAGMSSTNPLLAAIIPVAGTFAVCLVTSFCDIAAPSISLEGKNIWMLQVLPVDPYAVFKAKLFVHISITGVTSLICTGAMVFVLQTDVFVSICMLVCTTLYVIFSASAMLALDLRRPMLDWTNETQPIKQSLNILFSMFGGLLLSVILAGLYFLLGAILSPGIYLLICIVIFAVLTLLIHKWLRGKGRARFADL